MTASSVPAKDYPIIGINAQLAQDTPEYTLNLYAEKESDEVMTLKPTPGARFTYQFTPSGGGRGMNATTGRLFGVRGVFFQEIVNGVAVTRGVLQTTTGIVSMISCLPPNGAGQILIVDGVEGYVFVFNGVSALGYIGTSATSNVPSLGLKYFTFTDFLNYQVNDPIYIYETTNPANSMTGFVVSYDPTSGDMVVVVTAFTGSGTIAAWTCQLPNNAFVRLPFVSGFVGGNSQTVFCASRAVTFKPSTQQFQLSGQYDFTTWDGTAYATCQSLSQPLVALASNGGLCYFFTGDGFEVWEDMGYAIQPLGRIIFGDQVGCLAPNSVFVFKRYVYWLGSNSEGKGQFYRHIVGSFPERISDSPTERIIGELPNQNECVSYAYQSFGHDFYVNTFITGNLSICHDASTGLWHERAWRQAVLNQKQVVPYISVVFYNGQLLGQSYLDGSVFTIDNNTFTDNGNPIIRQRITPVYPPEGDWQTYFQSVELFGQTGNTPVTNIPVQLVMEYSVDRGVTWSQELWQQSGSNNSYVGRTRWMGLGAAYGMCFRFTVVCDQYISWRKLRLRAA